MASYKTSIAFGLVYIPVSLTNVIKNNDIGFNMLDKRTRSRVKYKKTCEECEGKELENSDIIKGYKVDEDYVTFTDAELEKLKGKKDKNIVIEKFVKLDEISPIFFDKAYYVSPQTKGANKAYCLLKKVLSDEKKVGIAKTMLGSSECVVALWVKEGSLILSRLFFYDEVQSNQASDIEESLSKQEIALAKNLISSMEGEFNPEEYKDEYNIRLRQAILDKANGKEVRKVDGSKTIKITDLMEALQRSVDEVTQSKKVKKIDGDKVVKIRKKA